MIYCIIRRAKLPKEHFRRFRKHYKMVEGLISRVVPPVVYMAK